jgi:hypothetical protein
MIAFRQPVKKFAYVDSTIVRCRLHGIYKHFINERYDRMLETIADTIAVLRYTPYNEMDMQTNKRVMEALERSRIDAAVKNYKGANKRLRELFYELDDIVI